MKELIVVLPALTTPWEVVDTKVLRVASALAVSLKVYVHAYSPALRRSYFFGNSPIVDAQKHFKASVKKWCEELAFRLDENALDHRIEVVWEREIDESIEALQPSKGSMLMLVNVSRIVSTSYRRVIRHAQVPVLILDNRPWKQRVGVAAAIDPLHESNLPICRDTEVVLCAKWLARSLSSPLELVHSCFVPAYLTSYKKEMLSHHRANIRDFINDGSFGELAHVVISGDPEISLREYVNDSSIQVLAIGSVARGMFDRPVIGSTTDNLLSNMPCDLLLVHS